MNPHRRHNRKLWLVGGSVLALWGVSMLATWAGTRLGGLEGRYSSSGQVQLSDQRVIEVSHGILFNAGRFYAMTRQGDAILETSGSVERDLWGRYRLRVERGDVSGLSSDTDDELLFNLLYGRYKGSTITLMPLHDTCLYGMETHQIYCADEQHGVREPVEVSKRAAAKRQQIAQSASLLGARYSAPLAE
jgi:hypothetical protein